MDQLILFEDLFEDEIVNEELMCMEQGRIFNGDPQQIRCGSKSTYLYLCGNCIATDMLFVRIIAYCYCFMLIGLFCSRVQGRLTPTWPCTTSLYVTSDTTVTSTTMMKQKRKSTRCQAPITTYHQRLTTKKTFPGLKVAISFLVLWACRLIRRGLWIVDPGPEIFNP